MTTTSIFQGIPGGTRISSRVNHPPGGAAKIHDEAKREPKTVRVLKPPGGGSSISFSEDTNYRREANGAASSPPPKECSSPSGADEAPSFEAAAVSPQATTPAEGKDVIESPSDIKELPRNDSSNGTTPSEASFESAEEIPSPDPSKPTPSDVDLGNQNKEEVSCNGVENGSSAAVTSHDVDTSKDISEACDKQLAITAAEERETITVSSETHQTSTEISSVKEHTTVQSSDVSSQVVEHSQQNGSSPAKVKAPSPEPSRPAVATPTTPTPSSPSKPSEDTTDRMFGQPTNTSPQNPPPRKIKDHMRSNIFMSDEDYTPTRSSRMNAAVVKDTSPNVPAAGQRQRIPPGGFSTKLW